MYLHGDALHVQCVGHLIVCLYECVDLCLYVCECTKLVNATVFTFIGLFSCISVKEVNNQLIAVFNFFLTVIGSFVFAYKAVEYSLEKPNMPTVSIL